MTNVSFTRRNPFLRRFLEELRQRTAFRGARWMWSLLFFRFFSHFWSLNKRSFVIINTTIDSQKTQIYPQRWRKKSALGWSCDRADAAVRWSLKAMSTRARAHARSSAFTQADSFIQLLCRSSFQHPLTLKHVNFFFFSFYFFKY